ncbi:MAG: transposase [Burkholderiaceae bacterium]|nr:transposase [Burkholderiaceae bacterium]
MEESKREPKRKHSVELKSRVLAECAQPGASVAAVAMAHGLNANLVHKWRRSGAAAGMPTAALPLTRNTGNEFIAVALSTQATPVSPCDIRIELRRGATTMSIHWPTQAVHECATWLREWLR